MKKAFIVVAATAAIASSASAQVIESWLIAGGSGAASGNTWLNGANAGRGMDFIAGGASQNTYPESILAIAQGTGATDNIQILAADDGQNLGSFAMTATGDATLSHYRVAASDDGFIFVNGFAGTVQQYTVAGALVATPIDSTLYGTISPAVSGSSRALEVTGSVTAGTAKVFVGRGGTIVVFGNSPSTPATFDYLGQIALGLTGDLTTIGSSDGLTVYSGVGSGVALKKITFAYSPFSATIDGDTINYAVFAKQGVAVNSANNLMAISEAGGAEDGFAIATIEADGLTLTNINPATGDSDSDNLYDAGSLVLNTPTLANDVAMDPSNGVTYGYSAGTGATPTDGGVFSIKVTPAATVGEWNLY